MLAEWCYVGCMAGCCLSGWIMLVFSIQWVIFEVSLLIWSEKTQNNASEWRGSILSQSARERRCKAGGVGGSKCRLHMHRKFLLMLMVGRATISSMCMQIQGARNPIGMSENLITSNLTFEHHMELTKLSLFGQFCLWSLSGLSGVLAFVLYNYTADPSIPIWN